ncbi:XRE family transcriptional regulator [Streptomyces sp. NPDC049555]|uniref:helix-turn-helix domain-containing protein n=1 Tax=Streptomyces sp. NPDC049555 TaxID=3154930 RepID=UPI0034306C5E
MSTRLRLLRKQNRLSLEALAQQAGVTKSYLSKVERGLSVPSISTAMKLARVLGVDVGRLFAEEVEPELITVVRAGERTPVAVAPGTTGATHYEGIATGVSGKAMAPFMMRPPLAVDDTSFKSHAGEEFLFVHEGEVELVFPERSVLLGPGDSVYFKAEVPHRSRSVGEQRAAVLVVIHDEPCAATCAATGGETSSTTS